MVEGSSRPQAEEERGERAPLNVLPIASRPNVFSNRLIRKRVMELGTPPGQMFRAVCVRCCSRCATRTSGISKVRGRIR